mmetsp:Transcript_57124/g.85081  ORF Transcript_57124/g.85081 Transcript_57124/m.85081 type:complete len:84 (+) Transcript_57124:781-1032(+)
MGRGVHLDIVRCQALSTLARTPGRIDVSLGFIHHGSRSSLGASHRTAPRRATHHTSRPASLLRPMHHIRPSVRIMAFVHLRLV